MGFKIKGKTNTPEGFMKPHRVDKWYTGRKNGWVVQTLDKHDNQIGEAEYVYHKHDAEQRRKDLIKHHGLKEEVAANSIGAGHIAKFDPLLQSKRQTKKKQMSALLRRWMQGR